MRINTKSTLLTAAIALSLSGTVAFAQSTNAKVNLGAQAATPAVPAVPATPAVQAMGDVADPAAAVPAIPAVPATPAVNVDASANANASLDPTAVAREHESTDPQAGVSADATADADAKADAKPAKKVAKAKKKKPL